MRFLFISYKYPGILGGMAAWLARQPENEVIFASNRTRSDSTLMNVRRVVLKRYSSNMAERDSSWFSYWEEAGRASRSARSSYQTIKSSGFHPDIVLSASSNGTALGIQHIFPEACWFNFLEEGNFGSVVQSLLRHDIQSLQILHSDFSYTFSQAVPNDYPEIIRGKIRRCPFIVDTDFFSGKNSRDTLNGEKNIIIKCVTQNLGELYKIFRACLTLARKQPEARIWLVVQGSQLAQRCQSINLPEEVAGRLRIAHFQNQYDMRDLLCSARLIAFLYRPTLLDILIAMSCGTVPLYSQGDTFPGLDLPKLDDQDMDALINGLEELLANDEAILSLGRECAEFALINHSANHLMPEFYNLFKSCPGRKHSGSRDPVFQ